MKLLAAKEFNKVFYACYDGKATKHRMKVRAELVQLGMGTKNHTSALQAKLNAEQATTVGCSNQEAQYTTRSQSRCHNLNRFASSSR
jgi:hypothetical protein